MAQEDQNLNRVGTTLGLFIGGFLLVIALAVFFLVVF